MRARAGENARPEFATGAPTVQAFVSAGIPHQGHNISVVHALLFAQFLEMCRWRAAWPGLR